MKVIADLCIVPLGVGVSVSPHIAACQKILRAARNPDGSPLLLHLHAYGTNIEGDWDTVFAAIKQCHQSLHATGTPRLTTTLKIGTRTDREQTMQDKIQSVEEKLKGDNGSVRIENGAATRTE